MKDLITISNAMTDLICDVTEKELNRLNLVKGSYKSAKKIDLERFLKFISCKDIESIPGGSPANVACGVQHYYKQTGIIGIVGDDDVGRRYVLDLKNRGIDSLITEKKGKSGVCYTLITPDGERTFVTDLGVSADFDFNLDILKDYKILHTSSYELVGNEVTRKAIDYFHNDLERIVSFDLAGETVIRDNREAVEDIIKNVDVLFVTEEELEEIKEIPIKSICDVVLLKMGKRGSIIYEKNKGYCDVPPFSVEVVDTNGAGDAYAAGFLAGYLVKPYVPLEYCGINASVFAGQICAKKGARI